MTGELYNKNFESLLVRLGYEKKGKIIELFTKNFTPTHTYSDEASI